MTDEGTDAAGDALAARLAAIDRLPLADRASAYAALHAELTAALETPPPTVDPAPAP